ncbi:hypothetical protein LIER_41418 [Lithospermum erythrorhizon]|uniref:GAG-pre-integrase domain-containing protein n=1 Tax=Lithospermum erythrorhizon TaxID=34254 RepID=A0AAV3RB18_LITER
MNTPLEVLNDSKEGWQNVITSFIQQEVGKALKEKESGSSSGADHLEIQANLVGFDHFAVISVVVLFLKPQTKLWYSRLGHVSSDVLKHLFKDIDFTFTGEPCFVFPLAKQQRLMFNKASDHSVVLFDLIHIDL